MKNFALRMAALESDGYAAGQASPIQKTNPGEYMGDVKSIYDVKTLTAAIANGDTVEGPLIPEGARVLDAYLHAPVSLGATGIFSMGTRAHKQRVEGTDDSDVAEDADSLTGVADAGGQAALTRAVAGQALLGKKIGAGGARIFLTCTEDTGVFVAGMKLEMVVVLAFN